MATAFARRLQDWVRIGGAAAAFGWIAAPLSAQAPVSVVNPIVDKGSARASYDEDVAFRPGSRPCPAPTVPCPTVPYPVIPYAPGVMPVPGTPTQPGSPSLPGGADMGPGNTPAPGGPNSDTAGNGAFGAAPSAGSGGGNSFNVNMFGDALGGHSVRVTRTRTLADLVRYNGRPDIYVLKADGVTFSSAGPHTLFGVPIGSPNFVAQSGPGLLFGTNNSLLENAAVTSALQHSSLAQPGETVKFVSGMAIGRDGIEFSNIFQVYNFISATQIAGSGGVVGRQKMSEDTSPLPRDRIIFDYDCFSGANLGPSGTDVHRIVVGFEKTFFDGRASIEVRIPFASTLDSSNEIGVQSRDTELGDIRITPRFLVYRSETLNVGAGVGFYLPTASDTRIRDEFGTELLRFSEDSLVVSPYLGVLYTPNDRFFAQGWVSVDFDTNGDAVSANLTGAGLSSIGRYRSGNQMDWDAQIGYWLISPSENNGRLRGLAPFLELHYGSQVSNSSNLQAGEYQIAAVSQGDELNLTAGVLAQIGPRLSLQIGGVVPLIRDSREFDWQVGIRMNYFFGPTAANANRATFVP